MEQQLEISNNKQFSEFISLDASIDPITNWKASDVEQLKVIGRGALGQVALVRVMICYSKPACGH